MSQTNETIVSTVTSQSANSSYTSSDDESDTLTGILASNNLSTQSLTDELQSIELIDRLATEYQNVLSNDNPLPFFQALIEAQQSNPQSDVRRTAIVSLMKGTIYEARCLATNELYVGSTIQTLPERKIRHISHAKRDPRPNRFHERIKDGRHREFEWTVLEVRFVRDKPELLRYEQRWIDRLTPGLNTNAACRYSAPDDEFDH